MNKKTTSFLLLLAGVVAFVACKKDEDTPVNTNIVQLTAPINAASEVPLTPSTATGTFTGSIDKTTRLLTYEVAYTGMTATAGHLHKGAPGKSGPVDIGFSSVGTSPIKGTFTLTQSKLDSMTAGLYYVNLHSTAYPAGEIRGNVVVK